MIVPTDRVRIGSVLLSVLALLLPSVGLYAPLGMAPALIIMGLIALVMLWPQWPWQQLRHGIGLWAVAVSTIGLVLAAWAIEPGQSAKVAVIFVGMAFFGLTLRQALASLSRQQARRLFACLLTGSVVALAVLCADILTCGAILAKQIWHVKGLCIGHGFIYKRGLTVLILLLIPLFSAVEHLWPRAVWRLAILGLGAAALATALWLGSETLLGVGILGGAAFIMVRLWGTTAIRLLGVGSVVLALSTPAVMVMLPVPGSWPEGELQLPTSLHHRITIWQFAGQRWLEKPLLGWGLDASREMPGAEGRYRVSLEQARSMGWSHGYDEQFLPLHTHSIAVQWWLELGVPGGILLAVLVWLITRKVIAARGNPNIRAITAAAAISIMVVSLLSFGAWQSWWLSTIWIIAALMATSTATES